MAKLFYTLDEAASKLKMSEADVKNLVASGQLQEFRDRDKLMFKVDQVNLLAAGGDEDASSASASGVIPLAESGELRERHSFVQPFQRMWMRRFQPDRDLQADRPGPDDGNGDGFHRGNGRRKMFSRRAPAPPVQGATVVRSAGKPAAERQ